MNEMQPLIRRRAPLASIVLDRSRRVLPPGTERFNVPGAGSVAVSVSAGDVVRVRDIEGCQPCELIFAGTDGRIDPGGLGVPTGDSVNGLMALLAGSSEGIRQTRSALTRRAIDLAGARGIRVFGGELPAGSVARFTVERDGLIIVCAPGGVMDQERQDTASEIELTIARVHVPTIGEAMRLPEPLADPIADFRVAARTAEAYVVKAGDYIQVIDVEGRQCTDFQCFSARKLDQGRALPLDLTVTRTLIGRSYPLPGLPSKGFAQDFEPLVELVQDSCGRHDAFATACNSRYYDDMGYPGHVNCTDNFNRVLAPYGVPTRKGWEALKRPLRIAVPFVAAGLEHDRFGKVRAALVLQIEIEERQLDVRAVVRGGLRAELMICRACRRRCAPSRRAATARRPASSCSRDSFLSARDTCGTDRRSPARRTMRRRSAPG